MASKAAIEKGEEHSARRQEPGALSDFSGNAIGVWTNFTRFLTDVRAEMRKVVAPARKEVQSTTTVVIITVFLFGFFFFVVDFVFNRVLHHVLTVLGGAQ
jgi:preprotein translocase subunit SecE